MKQTVINKMIIIIIIVTYSLYYLINYVYLKKDLITEKGLIDKFNVVDIVKTTKNNSTAYFNNFNISFSGYVISKKLIYGNRGLIKIALRESVDTLYDVRASNSMYFCVLTDSLAEVVTRHFQISVGDSLVFNGLNDSIYIYREGFLEESWQPHINNNVNIFDDIRKMHDL